MKPANNSVDHYAVMGNPVAHSKSPDIHQAFAKQAGHTISYQKQQVTGNFKQAADDFFNAGGCGLNVTVPFKVDAFHYAGQLSGRAKHAQAVNTLIRQENGSIAGDNTDGVGLLRDLCELLGWQLRGRRVLILGAGGAVKGVLEPLLAQQPGELVIANRTVSRATALADSTASTATITACGFDQLEGRFDIIINGTAASISGDLPPLSSSLIGLDSACYDMMYGSEPTVFLRWAIDSGVTRYADGLGMLVCQAAESYRLWRGFEPEVEPVVALLRQQLKPQPV